MELRYTDENDKCYGLTGMAISMIVWDADEIISMIDLDATGDECLKFIPTYFYSGNPRVSAKASWQHIFRHFQISIGMTIGNVMCRSHLLHHRSPATAMRDSLLDLARKEGIESCSLDDDEVARIFTKSYDYLDKIFAHGGVQQVTRTFAENLAARRSMSRADIVEALAPLSHL